MSPPVVLHHAEDGPPGGPAVVLLGSLGTTHRLWDGVRPSLAAAGLRVVAVDLRGHGASPAPPGPYDVDALAGDVLALLDRLGLARAALVGLSLGGMVALRLAAREPARVASLAALCTSAHVPPAGRWLERAAAVRAAGSTAPIAHAVVARWITPAWTGDRDALRAMLLAQPAEGYAACCEALATLDLRDETPAIAAPALVVGGLDDEAIPPDHQERLAAAIPGARLALLRPAAHLAVLEQPGLIAALLLDHLTTPTGAPP